MSTSETWISRTSWGLAHLLRPDSAYQYLGVEYARTCCGLKIRSDQIAADVAKDQCKRCITLTKRWRGYEK